MLGRKRKANDDHYNEKERKIEKKKNEQGGWKKQERNFEKF